MRSLLILLAAAAALLSRSELTMAQTIPAPAPTRASVTLNREWTFNYLPDSAADGAGCEAPAFDDAKWPVVALPHTWQTYETTREKHPYIRSPAEGDDQYWWKGWGWYRKTFTIDASQKDRAVLVEFDGVMKYSKIYVNGKAAGEHKGGFNSFSVDITPHVKFGYPNTLAVAVNNLRVDQFRTPPMAAGNWNVYGGIYRDVRLVTKNKLHIPFQGNFAHEGGTFITTPDCSAESATVKVKTWVKNDYAHPIQTRLLTKLFGPDAKLVASMESYKDIKPGEFALFEQTSDKIATPKLWSPESPAVYTAISEVYRCDIPGAPARTDVFSSPFGFRSFHWDYAANRLVLNGKPVAINGTNRHQEYPWLGDAIPKWVTLMDLHDIRYNLGHNHMRTAHYTQDRLVYDYADRHGILTCEEVPNIKNQDFAPDVQKQQVIEMIRRDRNHPSIYMWSMGNETNHAADSAWAVAEDDTRIIHARAVHGPSAGAFAKNTHNNLQMEQLLKCTIRGWTHDDIKKLPSPNPQTTGNETLQADIALKSKNLVSPNLNVWLYEDHGADREYTDCPLKHVNPKGWVDSWRVPKYMYYLWQANFAPEPMVFIQPHYWTKRYAGQQKPFVVYTNCSEVELFADGKSLGKQALSPESRGTVTFDNVTVGTKELKAIATRDGKTVERVVKMAGDPAAITAVAIVPTEAAAKGRLTPDKSSPVREFSSGGNITAATDSVFILRADIVDAAGTPVQQATNSLTFQVSGPAVLLTPDTYESDIDKKGEMEGTMYITTPTCTVLRSTGEQGTITVTVSSPTLKPATLTVTAVAEPQETSIVTQPTHSRAGREPVKRLTPRTSSTADLVLKEITDDLTLAGTTVEDFTGKIESHLRKSNPLISTFDPDFRALVAKMADHLAANKGHIIRDDYNHMINTYNAAVLSRDKASKPGKKGK